jgi:VWFA-related protein
MSRQATTFVVAALLFASSAAGYPDDPAYRIEMLGDVDASAFPDVTVRFRILDAGGQPATRLPQEDIVILEDGKEVKRVRPARLKDAPSAVVLALDTSGSMAAGQRMAEAKAAAGRFFARLDAKTPCGLVLFHHESYLKEAPTFDRAALKRATDAARAAGGTAYLDAVNEALELLPETPGEKQHAVVVMTDGRDVNSAHTLRQTIAAARRRHTPVYTLGLGKPGHNVYVRTILVLDKSGSMREGGKIEALQQAATRFVQLMPAESADTNLLVFSDRIQFPLGSTDFTGDKRALRDAIQRLQASGGTRLYDAIYEALDALAKSRQENSALGDRPAREAVVVLTDGMDQTSRSFRYDLDVIPYAKRLGIPVHMLGLGPGDELNEAVMTEIAASTGGRYRHVRTAADLTEVFEELSIDLHDGGIDEPALRALAKETGGAYHPIRDAERLQTVFEQLAADVQNTHAITFRSLRSQPDGTGRSVKIKLGELARAVAGYKTHGLITPKSDPELYLAGLGTILVLLAVPALWRRTRQTGLGASEYESTA